MTSLGCLETDPNYKSSGANDVNDLGQVVGYTSVPGSTSGHHAFLYSGGIMTDLGTVPNGSTAPVDTCAYGINNNSQVVGAALMGYSEGSAVYHAFQYTS
jgi:probable HAF family extracellular repeat protein